MSKGFVYRGATRSTESIIRRSKEGSGAYDSWLNSDIPMYKAKEGECTIRTMPATWDDTDTWGDDWSLFVWVHYSVGADKSAYLCLDKMKGEPCPACEAREEATDEEERKELRPSKRPLCYLIDRDAEKAGPQAYAMPMKKLFNEIQARSFDKKTRAPILIDHPEEGFDVIFNRKGTSMTGTDYSAVEVSRDPTPLHDDPKVQKRWLDFIEAHPLPDILNYYEYDHIKKALFGKIDRRTQEAAEDDDVPPSRSSRRSAVADSEDDPISTRRNGAKHTAAPAEPEPEDDEPPFEADPPRRLARRALLDEGEEAPEADSTVASARRSLERLKTRPRAS